MHDGKPGKFSWDDKSLTYSQNWHRPKHMGMGIQDWHGIIKMKKIAAFSWHEQQN